jgi:hypothetical protein
VIALVATEGGILLSLAQPWPTSTFISTIAFAVYLGARVYGSPPAAAHELVTRSVGQARVGSLPRAASRSVLPTTSTPRVPFDDEPVA